MLTGIKVVTGNRSINIVQGHAITGKLILFIIYNTQIHDQYRCVDKGLDNKAVVNFVYVTRMNTINYAVC